MKFFLWTAISLLFIFSCTQETNEDKGMALVQAYDNVLFEKDIEDLLSGEESSEDSALIINAYIERWLRNQVMLYEAKEQIEDMERIDEMVEDYRRSLILYDYEEQLTTAMLDTIVPNQEVINYYEENQEDFILNQRVVGLMWWKEGEIKETGIDIEVFRDSLRNIALVLPEQDSLVQLNYFSYRDILRKFSGVNPNELPESIFSINHNGVKWRLLLLEEVREGEIAPLLFVRDEIEKLILHRRKIKLLQKIKEDNYQNALNKNRIKYIN